MKAVSMATSKGSAAAAGAQIGALSHTASDPPLKIFPTKCLMPVIRVSLPPGGLSGLAPSDFPKGPPRRPSQSRWHNAGAVRPERKPAIVRAHLHPPKDPNGPKDPQAGIK